ncbi:cytokinesis protein sepA-like [Capsicum chacoense]
MFTKHLPLLLPLFSLFLNFTSTTSGQECPYPCYPPPTGPVNNPPVYITPPPPPQGSSYNNYPPSSSGGGGYKNFPPPSSGGVDGYNNYPPPSSGGGGGYKNFPPPSHGGYNNVPYTSPPKNGYVNGLVPPPPNPILPWWPYRVGNRGDQFSSSISIQESTTMTIISTIVPILSLFFTLPFH